MYNTFSFYVKYKKILCTINFNFFLKFQHSFPEADLSHNTRSLNRRLDRKVTFFILIYLNNLSSILDMSKSQKNYYLFLKNEKSL